MQRPSKRILHLLLLSSSSPSSNKLQPHHHQTRTTSPYKKSSKRIKQRHPSVLYPPHLFSPSTFVSRNKSQRNFLSSFRVCLRGRLYEKILSRQQKSSTWTLRLASPFPSASFPRPTGTTTPRLSKLRLSRSSKSISPRSSLPDGKVNTLQANTATPKKRSVSRVKRNVAAVPVFRKSTTIAKSTGKSTFLSDHGSCFVRRGS